ncbi:MAG: radical SAM protein [Acidobacteria bacterium]|nr:radical SAM protein [Acidobacteriota bacterium]
MALVGIARLASLAEPLDAKRAVSYSQLPTGNYINRCTSPRMPFDWTINPYRGCEFGCKYCYARYTHEFMELRGRYDFETRIFAKDFHPAKFRRELDRIPLNEAVAIGTATDPYQPAERRYNVTRRMLEILADERGRQLSLTTKSDLVARDAPLFARVARANVLFVNITVTTVDNNLARILEPKAPRPDLRLAALRILRGHGIEAGVFASPALPGINDSTESLRAVAEAARAHGARYFHSHAVYLPSAARRVLFPFLKEEFPGLARAYENTFQQGMFIKGDYPLQLRARVEEIRTALRMAPGPAPYQPEEGWERQLSLF